MHGKNSGAIPSYKNASVSMPGASGPKILSPADGSFYKISSMLKKNLQKIELKAAVASGADSIYWFLNGEVTATAKPDESVFILPEPGKYKVTVQDSFGGYDSSVFEVEEEK
jgi:membrane carboxypeptidase/penicillin-binding protein PbpC